MNRVEIRDIEEEQTKALLNGIKDADDDTKSTYTNILIVARGCKKEVGILPILVVVITDGRSTKDAIFIIGLIVGISLISIDIVDAGIKKIVKSKVVGTLIKMGNTDEVVVSWESKE